LEAAILAPKMNLRRPPFLRLL